jgi:hypothetical protein
MRGKEEEHMSTQNSKQSLSASQIVAEVRKTIPEITVA